MEFTVETKDDISIFRLSGDFTFNTKEPLRIKIFEALEEGRYKFIFNFKDLTFLDSSALGLLIKSAKSAYTKGLHVKITNTNDRIHQLIEQAKLSMLLDLVPTEQAAIKEFNAKQ